MIDHNNNNKNGGGGNNIDDSKFIMRFQSLFAAFGEKRATRVSSKRRFNCIRSGVFTMIVVVVVLDSIADLSGRHCSVAATSAKEAIGGRLNCFCAHFGAEC